MGRTDSSICSFAASFTTIMQQRQQHARFHAAVLRNLFLESSSPALSPTSLEFSPSDVSILARDVAPTANVANRHSDSEEELAKRHSDIEDGDNAKTSLSRAQRKRRKLKKLKEKQSEAVHLGTRDRERKVIGPLLPESQFYSQNESPEPSGRISLDNLQQENNMQAHASERAKEGKRTCNSEEGPHSLNRAKRRRLAKKVLSKNLTRFGIMVRARGRACGHSASRESATDPGSGSVVLTWDEQVQRMEVGDERDPGVAISWADDAQLHNCLGVAGAPVPQGAGPPASGITIRAWFSNIVTTIAPNAPVILTGGGSSSEFFHHLKISEYGHVVETLLSVPINYGWGGNLNAAGLSAGRFYMVTDKGRGRNNAMHQSYAPFL